MALVNADRVKETSTTTGTGTYTLAGAVTGFRTFVAGVGDGNTCWYCATDDTDWEVGVGTVDDLTNDTLARTTIIASSNAGAAVNWGAGTKTIFCTLPAQGNLLSSDNILCSHAGLVVKKASDSTVDIDASALSLKDSADRLRRVSSVNLTVSIASAGENGLDTGSEAANTWYAVHVAAKEDGTLCGLLSLSATAPTLPTDYLYSGLVGFVRNNGSSNFKAFFQRGKNVTALGESALASGTATTYTSIDLAALVPPVATHVLLSVSTAVSSGTAASFTSVVGSGTTTTPDYGQIFVSKPSGIGTGGMYTSGRMLLVTAQTIYYYVSGTNALSNISTEGWDY